MQKTSKKEQSREHKENTKNMTLYRRALYLEFFLKTTKEPAYLKLNHNLTRTNQCNMSVKVSRYIDTSESATITIPNAPNEVYEHIMRCDMVKIYAGWIDDSNPFKPDITTGVDCIHTGKIRLKEQKTNKDISILSFHNSLYISKIEPDKKAELDPIAKLKTQWNNECLELWKALQKYMIKYPNYEQITYEQWIKNLKIPELFTSSQANNINNSINMLEFKEVASLSKTAETLRKKKLNIIDLKKQLEKQKYKKEDDINPDFTPFVIYGKKDPRSATADPITYQQFFANTNMEYQRFKTDKSSNHQETGINLSEVISINDTNVFKKYSDIIKFINHNSSSNFGIYYSFKLQKHVVFDVTTQPIFKLSWKKGLIDKPVIDGNKLQFTMALQPYLKPNRIVEYDDNMLFTQNTTVTEFKKSDGGETQANKGFPMKKEIKYDISNDYDNIMQNEYIITKVEHNFSNYIADLYTTSITAGVYYEY